MKENELYHLEIGRYLQSVSPDYPVGVCLRCGALRARTDVNPKELCPSSLLEYVAFAKIEAAPHQWQATTDSAQLQSLLQEHFPTFKQYSAQASKLVS